MLIVNFVLFCLLRESGDGSIVALLLGYVRYLAVSFIVQLSVRHGNRSDAVSLICLLFYRIRGHLNLPQLPRIRKCMLESIV